MNLKLISALVLRDLRLTLKSKGVMLPMLIVPILSLVLLPVLAVMAPTVGPPSGSTINALGSIINWMAPELQAELANYTTLQRWVMLVLVYFLAPLFLVVPLMVASVIAADSFAGEKERKTMEALLYTPSDDRELFVAKLLSAWIPAMSVAFGSFILYAFVANWVAWPIMDRFLFPNAMWLVLVGWVAPAVAGMGLSVTILISSRVQSFQEAFQLGGFVVLPIVILLVGQIAGLMYFSLELVFLLGLAFWVVDGLLILAGSRLFTRENLLSGRM